MILYYFHIAQNTGNKTVSEKFYRDVYACICMRTYFTIFLFTGVIPVYVGICKTKLLNRTCILINSKRALDLHVIITFLFIFSIYLMHSFVVISAQAIYQTCTYQV